MSEVFKHDRKCPDETEVAIEHEQRGGQRETSRLPEVLDFGHKGESEVVIQYSCRKRHVSSAKGHSSEVLAV